MLIRIEVRLLGMLRSLAGADRLSLEVERSNVRSIIRVLTRLFPIEAKRLFTDHDWNDPRANALILLNGREISALDGLETQVSDGDEITLVPVVHGG